MRDIKIVSVDSRGKSSSDIEAYHEHIRSLAEFQKRIAAHPDAVCHRSKVALLCDLDLKIYFHKNERVSAHVKDKEDINYAASLLTLDPETGSPKYYVTGVAYVIMNDGVAPLSLNQVWGIVELTTNACDYYQCHPASPKHGKSELERLVKLYREQCWGPLSIYKNREEIGREENDALSHNIAEGKSRTYYTSHYSSSRKPFSNIQG
jgi:hypothetical protein